jgi:hydroxyacylglutathione hydrolase
LDREPNNEFAKKLLHANKDKDPTSIITTIGEEKNINAFFRLQSSSIIDKLRESFKDLDSHPSPETVFLKLRELRNHW